MQKCRCEGEGETDPVAVSPSAGILLSRFHLGDFSVSSNRILYSRVV